MNENDAELKIIFGSMKAKINALKSALNPDQLEKYNESLTISKEKLRVAHPDFFEKNPELIEMYFDK